MNSRRVQHFDRLELRFDKSSLRTNADGSRIIDGFGAHVGNYTYHDDKGRPFVEHVPAQTLFDSASLDSAAGSTLTIRHGPGLVTPDRYRAESHGSWVKAWDAGNGKLGVRLRLGSQDALNFVDEALAAGNPVELSPVYEVDVIDSPGATEHGRHDAVQEGRLYSGIALLGPHEARGGTGMRLQLDGPECAPKGTRIQVRARQLDSAALAPLHSATGRPNIMKQSHIQIDGKRHSIPEARARGLAHLRIGSVNSDQIETGTVTVEIEGEEPSELVLPVSMIEMLLEGIGATPSAPPAEEPMEMEEQTESLDAEDEEKMDSKAVKAFVIAELKRQSDARDKRDSRRASVNADAARCLPEGYSFEGPWTQWALDAIARVSPDDEARARKLASDAAKDPVAEGMLRQLLADRSRSTADAKVRLADANTNTDAADPKPWLSPEPPKVQ